MFPPLTIVIGGKHINKSPGFPIINDENRRSRHAIHAAGAALFLHGWHDPTRGIFSSPTPTGPACSS
jgi:hypothetical protein